MGAVHPITGLDDWFDGGIELDTLSLVAKLGVFEVLADMDGFRVKDLVDSGAAEARPAGVVDTHSTMLIRCLDRAKVLAWREDVISKDTARVLAKMEGQ